MLLDSRQESTEGKQAFQSRIIAIATSVIQFIG